MAVKSKAAAVEVPDAPVLKREITGLEGKEFKAAKKGLRQEFATWYRRLTSPAFRQTCCTRQGRAFPTGEPQVVRSDPWGWLIFRDEATAIETLISID